MNFQPWWNLSLECPSWFSSFILEYSVNSNLLTINHTWSVVYKRQCFMQYAKFLPFFPAFFFFSTFREVQTMDLTIIFPIINGNQNLILLIKMYKVSYTCKIQIIFHHHWRTSNRKFQSLGVTAKHRQPYSLGMSCYTLHLYWIKNVNWKLLLKVLWAIHKLKLWRTHSSQISS